MWKLPVVERSFVLVVVGVNIHDPFMVGDLLPAVREPIVTVNLVLPLLQAYVAANRALSLKLPPVILPRFTASVVAQPPLVVVLASQMVVVVLHTLLPVVGPVLGVIAWLKVKINWSPVSSLVVFVLT
jgi:hypothetical protein